MTDIGKSCFPIQQAFLFALQGIRLRLGRMLLVLAGVSVAIAFVSLLWTSDDLLSHLSDEQAAVSVANVPPAAGAGETPATLAKANSGLPVFRKLWTGVALLICAAGMINAIVMSVTERVKEIGTLKCLGSRNIHVVEIFLFESVLLGLLGGAIGGAAGYGAAVLNFVVTIGSSHLQGAGAAAINIVWAIAISVALSLVASVIPVLMAARIEPAAAMRYEV
jgi:hypothetical protein